MTDEDAIKIAEEVKEKNTKGRNIIIEKENEIKRTAANFLMETM